MRALSIHQPWANFVVEGKKRYETRPRRTNIRGIVAVHAAKKVTDYYEEGMVLGAIIGTIEIVDCFSVEEIRDHLLEEKIIRGNFCDGCFAWELKNPQKLKTPIRLRGFQGFWNLDENTVKLIEKECSA